MIIGYALKTLFSGMTISVNSSDVDVQFNYGNKDALDKFIALSDKRNKQKYPLIFYVTNPVREQNNYKYCDTDIIIMNLSDKTELSTARTEDSYIKYIEPVYQEMTSILTNSGYVFDISDKIDRYSYTDIPNYGIVDAKPPQSKSKESAITDYVDARIVKLRLKINTNCIK